MATPAHCAYCFESLSASLEKRQPLSLSQVEELWAKYTSSRTGRLQGEEGEETEGDPEDDDDDDDEIDPDEDLDMTDVEAPAATGPLKPPPAISRLVGGASPASASASASASSSSIPSTSTSTSTSSSSASSRSSAPTPASSRSSILSALRRSTRADQQQSGGAAISPTEAHPLFVTWNTVSRGGSKSLRGCIGTFEAQELSDGLRSYALTSAFDDSRFPPVTSPELPSLSCAVTLLTNFQPAASPMAWELGRHGLRISFTYHGRRYGATYLPDVAKEQGWTKEETMVSLMRKAGWSGRRDEWQRVQLNVVTYEGSKSSLGWEQWRAWREWCQGELGVEGRREMN